MNHADTERYGIGRIGKISNLLIHKNRASIRPVHTVENTHQG